MLTETLTASHTTRALLLLAAVRNSGELREELLDELPQLEEVISGVVNRVELAGGEVHYQPMPDDLRAKVRAERRRQTARAMTSRAMTSRRPLQALPPGPDAAT
jgi:hypothetical protein